MNTKRILEPPEGRCEDENWKCGWEEYYEDYEDPPSLFLKDLCYSCLFYATILIALFLIYGFASMNFASYITIKNIVFSTLFLLCLAATWSNLFGKYQLKEIMEESNLPNDNEAT